MTFSSIQTYSRGRISVIALILVVLIAVAIFVITSPSLSNETYSNQDMGLSFSYPSGFNITASSSPEKYAIVDLFSGDMTEHALLVFIVKDHQGVENDRKFYESMLFRDPGQLAQNSRVAIGDLSGFKALISPEQSRYTVYKSIEGKPSLIVRSEITASSSDKLLSLDGVFSDIIKSVKFYP